MKRYFNIIPSKECDCILLYGDICDWGEVKASEIVEKILENEREGKKIDVRINSVGGDVYSGIAIFNALRNSTADITIYIDCIAASIASVIASCGKPVKMSQYARIMIHRVSGGTCGTITDLEKCIEDINHLENSLCDIYSKRTGQTLEQIRATYFDGQEHWLNAKEALELGFIDEIYDSQELPDGTDPRGVSEAYSNRYFNSLTNKNQNTMFEKLKTRPLFANCADEQAIMAEVEKLETKAARTDELEAENTTLRTAQEEAQAATDAEFINQAVKAGKFSAAESPNYLNLMKKDRVATTAIVNSMRAKRIVTNMLDTSSENELNAWDQRMNEIKGNLKK